MEVIENACHYSEKRTMTRPMLLDIEITTLKKIKD